MDDAAPLLTLFDGRDVILRARAGTTGRAVATFAPRMDGLLKGGFGMTFLASHGLSGLHFVPRTHHWWQTPEMEPAVDAARRHLQQTGEELALAYGQSMGGTGALLFARKLGAAQALAFSPQASMHRDDLPVNLFWKQEAAAFPDIYPLDHAALAGVPTRIFVDPFHADDMCHVAAIRAVAAIDLVEVPFGGHGATLLLREMEMLSGLVLSVLDGSFRRPQYRQTFRQRRGGALYYWSNMLARAQHRPRLAQRIAERLGALVAPAIEEGRTSLPHLLVAKYILAQRDVAPDRALALSQAYLRAWPQLAGACHVHALILAAHGDQGQAALYLRKAIKLDRRNSAYRLAMVRLSCGQGDYDTAATDLRHALDRLTASPAAWADLSEFLRPFPLDAALKADVAARAH